MGNELYVKLAKESGLWDAVGYPKEAVAFANLVAAHEKKFWMEQIEVECNEAVLAEREACAKVCETDEFCCKCGDECAEAIRARSEK